MIPENLNPLVNAITGKIDNKKPKKKPKKKLTYYYREHKKSPK